MAVSDPTADAAYLQKASEDLDGVEAALERLDTGEFGRCERCGEPIEAERLEADPITTHCAAHA